jgi:hypothetical protein
MKTLNVSNMTLIHRGEDWPYPQTPCAKDMMSILERNERFISWFQPNASSNTEDQVPALYIHGVFYQLSLRMMKCVWRHVRLHKRFVNQEMGTYGAKKLKIPLVLYQEKIRTQRRFNVRTISTLINKTKYFNNLIFGSR